MDVRKAGGGLVLVQVEEQKVGDGQIVQPVGYSRVLANAVQRTAEDEFLAEMCVEEWLDAQMVARTKETLFLTVPDGEGKVPQQMLDAILAPYQIGAQN